MKYLEFIFQDFWHFIGCYAILAVILAITSLIVESILKTFIAIADIFRNK